MGEIRRHICDRCGEEIKADKLKAILNFTKKPRTIQYLKIWNDGVDPFGYTSENIELCSGCAKEFDEFMRQKS